MEKKLAGKYAYVLIPVLFAAVMGLWIVRDYYREYTGFAGDFGVYHAAAKAVLAHEDPWDVNVLKKINGAPSIPFLYSPGAALLLAPFGLMDLHTGAVVFMLINAAAFGILICVWIGIFREKDNLWLCLFAPILCHGAVINGIVSGNIPVFEQMFLWSAIYLYLKGNRLSGILLGAALMPKMVLVVFVVIFLCADIIRKLPQGRQAAVKKIRFILETSGIAVLFLSVMYVLGRILVAGVPPVHTLQGRSSHVAFKVGEKLLGLDGGMNVLFYLGVCAAISAVSAIYLISISGKKGYGRLHYLMFCALWYKMIEPHSAYYGYIIAVPAVWYLFKFAPKQIFTVALFVVLSVLALDSHQQWQPLMMKIINNGQPLTVLFAWIMYMWYGGKISQRRLQYSGGPGDIRGPVR